MKMIRKSFFVSRSMFTSCLVMMTWATTLPSVSAQEQKVEATMTVDLLDRVILTSAVDGIIETLAVRPGDLVASRQQLVQLDTQRLRKQLAIAQSEYEALRIRSQNDTREQVNLARQRSARFNVDKLNEVAGRYDVRVPALEMTRAVTELEQAVSETAGARQEMAQFLYEAEARLREIELLKFDIDQSTILSRYDGALMSINRHPGEFVQQGQAIAELYRLDRLSGTVLIGRDQILPEDAENVRGQFTIPGDDTNYPIIIKRVLPRVDVDGKYRAFVELENQKSASEKWRLLPGMAGQATFTTSGNRSNARDR